MLHQDSFPLFLYLALKRFEKHLLSFRIPISVLQYVGAGVAEGMVLRKSAMPVDIKNLFIFF